MTTPVTPLASDLSRLTDAEPSVTAPQDRARAATRERVARYRAAKRQAAAIEFVRTDASLFLHPDRLSQKAGAPKHHLRRMALKELVDNALDAAPSATLTEVDSDTFVITDDGPGLDPARVSELFSVTRPMMSTKLLRRPTRGAVGNGLRVATGAAFASGGQLAVESRGVRQRRRPTTRCWKCMSGWAARWQRARSHCITPASFRRCFERLRGAG